MSLCFSNHPRSHPAPLSQTPRKTSLSVGLIILGRRENTRLPRVVCNIGCKQETQTGVPKPSVWVLSLGFVFAANLLTDRLVPVLQPCQCHREGRPFGPPPRGATLACRGWTPRLPLPTRLLATDASRRPLQRPASRSRGRPAALRARATRFKDCAEWSPSASLSAWSRICSTRAGRPTTFRSRRSLHSKRVARARSAWGGGCTPTSPASRRAALARCRVVSTWACFPAGGSPVLIHGAGAPVHSEARQDTRLLLVLPCPTLDFYRRLRL